MEFLNFEQLKKILKDAEIIHCSDVLTDEDIEEIKKQIELKPREEFGKGKCLFNAYRVAEVTNAEIIEGVALVKVKKGDDEDMTFIKHAWNIIDDKHFDVTKDYVWPNLSARLIKIDYLSYQQLSYNTYNLDNDEIKFQPKVDLISSSLRFLHTKDFILNMLNLYGLSNKHYEQLLSECISTLKTKHNNA